LEAGIDDAASDNDTIGASYEGQFGDGATANGINVRMIVAGSAGETATHRTCLQYRLLQFSPHGRKVRIAQVGANRSE
jgi:hypothetical protein